MFQRDGLKYSRNFVGNDQWKYAASNRTYLLPPELWHGRERTGTVLTFSLCTVKRIRENTRVSEKQNRNSIQWRSFRTRHGHFKEKGIIAQSRYSSWSRPLLWYSSPGGVESVTVFVRRRPKDVHLLSLFCIPECRSCGVRLCPLASRISKRAERSSPAD